MPWNRTTRKDYKRDGRRYESDVTDKEWATLEPMIPKQGRLGRPRQTDLREVFNAIEYVLATGCQWRALPRDFPPYSTVINYFYRWQGDGVFDRMMDARARTASGDERAALWDQMAEIWPPYNEYQTKTGRRVEIRGRRACQGRGEDGGARLMVRAAEMSEMPDCATLEHLRF